MDGHLVNLHLGPPTRTATFLDGARASDETLTKGTAEILPPHVRISQIFDVPSEDLNVLLHEGFLRRVGTESEIDPDGFEVVSRPKVIDPALERLMLSFLSELESGGPGGELYAEGLATALAVHLLREHSSLGEKARRKVARGPAKESGLSARQLKRATDHIGDNLAAGDLSLAGLAAQANLSPFHFSRLFKRSTGMSPHQYVIRERVERAKGLLLRGDMPAAAVAREVGFSDQGHLSRHTRRLLGATPSEILKEGKAKDSKNLRA